MLINTTLNIATAMTLFVGVRRQTAEYRLFDPQAYPFPLPTANRCKQANLSTVQANLSDILANGNAILAQM